MTVAVVDGWDATHENLSHVPHIGQAAGYLTGSSKVRWTPADIARFPDAVMYDQSPVVTDFDTTADLLDVETGAAGDEDIVPFITEARDHFRKGTRPGQRWPGVYCSRNRVTEVCNVMVRGGLANGRTTVPLAIAHYTHDRDGAVREVANSSGPFPVVVRQYSDLGGGGTFDLDVYSVPWLRNRSKKMPDPGYKVTEPPPLTSKVGTPTVALGIGPAGQFVWVSYTVDGKNWTPPASFPAPPL